MSIAITDDHLTLSHTVKDFLSRRDARGDSRRLLEAPEEGLPSWWKEVAELGWLGLHLPEDQGGSGFGMEELVVVVEDFGRAVAPSPFVPTVIVSAVLAASGSSAVTRHIPGLADGTVTAGVGLAGNITVKNGTASGNGGTVLGGATAQLVLLPAGDDAVLVAVGDGATVTTPPNLDPTRRTSKIELDNAPVAVLAGGRRLLTDYARLLLAAEAVGMARECT
ncbi:MAG TPA: acyl-CoA dehydrogenase family protein, partial [Ilumatobacteraceae bacterium]|nr:acyl-CoA dehydrogenase family protein [Ilumatobacteraceae bacterium]